MNKIMEDYRKRLRELEEEIKEVKTNIVKEKKNKRKLYMEAILIHIDDIKKLASECKISFDGYRKYEDSKGIAAVKMYFSANKMYEYEIEIHYKYSDDLRREFIFDKDNYINYYAQKNDGVITNEFKEFTTKFFFKLDCWIDKNQ